MFLRPTDRSRAYELTKAQIERARKGFRGMLWRKQFPPDFILNESDELLATAHSEMVRALVKGVEIEDPVAWTINCAYRRTQNYLQAESLRPGEVSIEKMVDLADTAAPTPEQIAEDADRARKIREAVAKLDEDQRKLIALTYFGGMSVREAGRSLNWHSSKVQRCHESALRTLRRKLPVRTSDELEIIIGLTSWLSFDEKSSLQLTVAFEAALDRAHEGVHGLWGRMESLVRRLPFGGGDTAAAIGSSGAGRAIGTCAAAIGIACFAGTSVVVIPGLSDGGSPSHAKQKSDRIRAVQATAPQATVETPTQAATSALQGEAAESASLKETPSERRRAAQAARERTQRREAEQVEAQTSGIARAASESSREDSGATVSSSPETVVVPPAPTSPSGAATSAEAAQAKQQFGAFK